MTGGRRPRKPVTRLATIAIAVAAVAAALLLSDEGRSSSALDPAAERASEAYLRALVAGDGATLLRFTPRKLENRYGPFPFTEMPRLEEPRVDAHRGGVMFKGRTKAGDIPNEGAVTLTLLDHVRIDRWRVRQVAFFERLPFGLKLPKRSITRSDRAQESQVVAAAQRYLAAWKKGDYSTMAYLSYEWLPRVHALPGARIRSVEFRAKPSEGGETVILFSARLSMYRLLPKQVEGRLFAMREDGEWRIRGTELTF